MEPLHISRISLMTRGKSVQNFIIPSLRVLYVERIEICCNFIDILTFKYLKGHFWEDIERSFLGKYVRKYVTAREY